MSTAETIKKQIAENPILLYMKGTPDNPQCGFSLAAVKALKKENIAFSYVNILDHPFIRERLPEISKWPTYPQLFINQELIGGSDIVCQLSDNGELASLCKKGVH